MEDKTLPPEGLSEVKAELDGLRRRAFLRRAVGVGVPIVIASVPGRSVLAQTEETGMSGCLSAHTSALLRHTPCSQENLVDEFATEPATPTEPFIDMSPDPDKTKSGKGHGRGGSKK